MMLAVFLTLPYTALVRETPVCHISVVYLRTLTIKVTRFLYTRVKIKRHKMKTLLQASRDRAEVRHRQTFPAK